jgi:hypothetical protein
MAAAPKPMRGSAAIRCRDLAPSAIRLHTSGEQVVAPVPL